MKTTTEIKATETQAYNMAQLSLNMGGLSGIEKLEPYKEGDIIVNHNGRRCVVSHVSDNLAGVVLCCVALDNGTDCVVLEREIAYRSR